MAIKRKASPPPAPVGNKRALGNRGGVGGPEKYDPTIPEQAFRLALLGSTDAELGEVFGVNESTINRWKLAHPEFAQALRRGKLAADADVAHGLYQRAIGWRNQAPDTAAAKHWLNNRRGGQWREKIEHAGDPTQPVVFQIIRAGGKG